MVDTDKIDWEADGTILLPTITNCLEFGDKTYAEDGLERFKSDQWVPGMPTSNFAKYLDYILNKTKILPIISDPTDEDTDGDGLLDGEPIIIDSIKVAPRDPEPLKANGPNGIWNAQHQQALNGDVATEYDGWYDIDWSNWEWGSWPSAFTGIGSYILQFRTDNLDMALHSDADNWQKIFGYNVFFDLAFKFGTLGNMRNEQFQFRSNGEDYIIWTWLGYYFNLGSGAEMGVYTNCRDIPVVGIEHWDVVDFLLPMTLSLFNYYSEDNIEGVFSWAPNGEQWWITGFNPEFDSPKAREMVMLGSIDFSGREEMFEDFRDAMQSDFKINKYLVFDEDDHIAWIVWGDIV